MTETYEMSESPVLITKDARGVATIAINRPQVRNAIDDRVIHSLTDAFKTLSADGETRIVVLTGARRRLFGRRRSRLDATHGGGQRGGKFRERKNDQRVDAHAQ